MIVCPEQTRMLRTAVVLSYSSVQIAVSVILLVFHLGGKHFKVTAGILTSQGMAGTSFTPKSFPLTDLS